MITQENWSYSYYNMLELRAFISLAGEPDSLFPDQVNYIYTATITNQEHKEIFQASHSSLELAIEQINTKHSHWNFENPLVKTSVADEGCGSCSAH